MSPVPPLTSIYFYVTGRCNLHCRHCYISADSAAPAGEELTAAEIRDVMDQALPLGLRSIKVSGGEPFLRRDIVEILQHAADRGLHVTLETNGTLLSDDLALALGHFKALRVCMSLDGFTAETHAQLRGSRVAHQKAVHAIESLVRAGATTEIITVVHEGNRGEIEDLVAFASDLGVDVYKINRLNPMGRANEMIEAGGHALSIEEVLAFNEFVEQHLNVNYTIPVRFDIPVVFQSLATVRRFRQSHCAIEGILGVLADGRASICGSGEEIEQLVFGDVRRQTVSEIWHKNQSLQHIREEVLAERNGLCQRCMMKEYCIGGYCRAHAYARYGDFRAPFPFCQEAYDAGLFPKARLLE